MKNRKKYIFFIVFSIILVAGFTQTNALDTFTKILDENLRGMPGGIFISEQGDFERIISGGYILKENKIEPVQTEKATITINKNTPEEYSFELIKFIKDGSVISVQSSKEGAAHNLIVGTKKILFTDQAELGLWVADINTLEPINIQPEKVNDISLKEIAEKKLDLLKQGKDPDSHILHWVSWPLLSPNESLVAFRSNRRNFPDNSKSSLWITDVNGNTVEVAVEKEDVIPVMWLNNNEICFVGENSYLKKVNINTGEISVLIDYKIKVNSYSPNKQYIMYQKVDGGDILPEMYVYNVQDGTNTQLKLPSGFKNIGFFGWDEKGSKVAFYIADMEANIKLAVANLIVSQVVVLDAPNKTRFDEYIVPSWAGNRVIFSAGGKLYSTNN
ncbi:MAG: hypothetical protein KGZ94_06730 [Clostridia bacterium]|nr:hypothetical protein [Clostridia bacterium]